ncbi:MAG TPA: ATP-binding protein [Verrucomicrobiae bacterium]|nr:ATP-binding protein [Verrucomicrobiae bacterium]
MRTIRRQLTWKLLVAFSLPLVFGGIAVLLSTRAALLEEFDTALRTRALAIMTATRQSGGRVDVEVNDSIMRESDEEDTAGFFQMWRSDGTTLKRSASAPVSRLPSRLGTLDRPKFWDLTLPSGAAGRAIGIKFTPQTSQEEHPTSASNEVILVVASDRGELNETLMTLAFALLGCGAGLLVITFVVVPRLLRRELAPLDALADRATRINADSLATRFPTASLPGELTPISTRLNDLLARLQQSFERERRFSADLAHELRTPIAELRTLAEVALKWPETREAATDREALAIAVQMEGVVTRLLALLRNERAQLPVLTERVHLTPLIENVWRPFAERAAGKQLKVTRTVADEAEVETDPVLLRSILTNLMDNAVEYTPHGGTVRVEADVRTTQFTLQMSNSCRDLTSDDVSHFSERFWRKDGARSDPEHSGLGLSLVKAFTERLGFQLEVRLVDPSTLSITVSGPKSNGVAETN